MDTGLEENIGMSPEEWLFETVNHNSRRDRYFDEKGRLLPEVSQHNEYILKEYGRRLNVAYCKKSKFWKNQCKRKQYGSPEIKSEVMLCP